MKDFELIDLVNNFYIVRTENLDHYNRILNEGPWVILDHCVLVQRWSPSFNPNVSSLGKLAIWIRLSNIPIQCYNKEILWRMGNCVGKTLRVDNHTLSQIEEGHGKTERGKFARLSVEIDLKKKLVPRILVRDELFNVEYESLNLICFGCGCYGHNRQACPHDLKNKTQNEANPSQNTQGPQSDKQGENNQQQNTQQDAPEKTEKTHINADKNPNFPGSISKSALPDEEFGDWMVVRRSGRRSGPRNFSTVERQPSTVERQPGTVERLSRDRNTYPGSRFDILGSETARNADFVNGSENRTVRQDPKRGSSSIPTPKESKKKEWKIKAKTGDKRGRTTDSETSDSADANNRALPSKARGKKPATSHAEITPSCLHLNEGSTVFAMDRTSGPKTKPTRVHKVVMGQVRLGQTKPNKPAAPEPNAENNPDHALFNMNLKVWTPSDIPNVVLSNSIIKLAKPPDPPEPHPPEIINDMEIPINQGQDIDLAVVPETPMDQFPQEEFYDAARDHTMEEGPESEKQDEFCMTEMEA